MSYVAACERQGDPRVTSGNLMSRPLEIKSEDAGAGPAETRDASAEVEVPATPRPDRVTSGNLMAPTQVELVAPKKASRDAGTR